MSRAIHVKWSHICIDDKCFVYGPRLGALYLLPIQNRNKLLYRVLGLYQRQFKDDLVDPALDILHDITEFKNGIVFPVSRIWCLIYRFTHWSKRFIPFNMMLKGMTKAVYFWKRSKQSRSPVQIAQILHAIEHKISNHDCYSRAIVTACLCAESRLPWEVTIGILSPTRMMHSWCATKSILPYEPFPEHYMYQPLIVFSKKYN